MENTIRKAFHVEATIEHLYPMMEKLREVLDIAQDSGNRPPYTKESRLHVEVCFEEVYVNIASYAYPDGTGAADISVEMAGDELMLVFEDSGIPCNPLEKEDPDLDAELLDRQIGGLGIYIVKKLMDHVDYVYRNGKNHLTLTKLLPREEEEG